MPSGYTAGTERAGSEENLQVAGVVVSILSGGVQH